MKICMMKGGEKMKKLAVIGSALAGVFGVVNGAFAADPTPIAMDTGVQAQIVNLLTSYVTVAFELLGVAIGVVGVLWISMRGIGLLFKYFHWFGH
jgi:hypothetical protein